MVKLTKSEKVMADMELTMKELMQFITDSENDFFINLDFQGEGGDGCGKEARCCVDSIEKGQECI